MENVVVGLRAGLSNGLQVGRLWTQGHILWPPVVCVKLGWGAAGLLTRTLPGPALVLQMLR